MQNEKRRYVLQKCHPDGAVRIRQMQDAQRRALFYRADTHRRVTRNHRPRVVRLFPDYRSHAATRDHNTETSRAAHQSGEISNTFFRAI